MVAHSSLAVLEFFWGGGAKLFGFCRRAVSERRFFFCFLPLNCHHEQAIPPYSRDLDDLCIFP